MTEFWIFFFTCTYQVVDFEVDPFESETTEKNLMKDSEDFSLYSKTSASWLNLTATILSQTNKKDTP